MGTIAYQDITPSNGKYNNSRLILWETMTNGDVGQAFPMPERGDRSVMVVGTPGSGGSVSLKWTNMHDDSTAPTDWTVNASASWKICHAADSVTEATFTTSGDGMQVLETAAFYRPEVTAGDGTTDLDVYLFIRGK